MTTELEGPDCSMEISLQDYGIAWKELENDFMFYYGYSCKETEDREVIYDKFCRAYVPKDVIAEEEYDWVNLEEVLQCHGLTKEIWDEIPLPWKVCELFQYYGGEEVFGGPFWESELLTYEQILEENGLTE